MNWKGLIKALPDILLDMVIALITGMADFFYESVKQLITRKKTQL